MPGNTTPDKYDELADSLFALVEQKLNYTIKIVPVYRQCNGLGVCDGVAINLVESSIDKVANQLRDTDTFKISAQKNRDAADKTEIKIDIEKDSIADLEQKLFPANGQKFGFFATERAQDGLQDVSATTNPVDRLVV